MRFLKIAKKIIDNASEFGTMLKESLMPGQNLEYSSGNQTGFSVTSIVLGTVMMIGGAASIAFIPPLGVTLLLMGGVAVAGGASYLIADKIIKNKLEKKQSPIQHIVIPKKRKRCPINSVNPADLAAHHSPVDFKLKKSTTRQFDRSKKETPQNKSFEKKTIHKRRRK